MKKYIGIDLGGMSAKGAVLCGNTLGKVCTCITSKKNTPEQIADALAALVKEILADIPSKEGTCANSKFKK